MEAADSSQKMLTIYQTIRRRGLEYSNIRTEDFTSKVVLHAIDHSRNSLNVFCSNWALALLIGP